MAKSGLQRIRAGVLFDSARVDSGEEKKFEELEASVEEALEKLNPILKEKFGRGFDFRTDSIHWILWACLSIKKPISRILEIGTYEGEGAFILARLFPGAKVTTVDLPENDPILRNSYERHSEDHYGAYLEKQKKNLSLENISSLKINSFFLGSHVSGKFDLIWVDGGHLFPEVAWDICNAWNMCSPEGYILCDDVLMTDDNISTKYVSSESYKVIRYLSERSDARMQFFLKRRDPMHYASALSRKYVALIQKPRES